MPRLARLDAPGVLHHVMGRGIERREIFLSDTDRNDFIGRMATLAEDGAMEIYAWVLMPNHFHMLCKTKKLPLASSMRRILTGYVVNFNKRHHRNGHLFQILQVFDPDIVSKHSQPQRTYFISTEKWVVWDRPSCV